MIWYRRVRLQKAKYLTSYIKIIQNEEDNFSVLIAKQTKPLLPVEKTNKTNIKVVRIISHEVRTNADIR